MSRPDATLPPPPALAHAPFAATVDASAGPQSPMEVQVTQRLGRFALLHELGSGGMGSVFAAYDEQLDRKVALKLLHQSQTQGDGRDRVLGEAQAMARVSHPNVVSVYDVGEVGGRIFIAMEYVDGVTLAVWQEQPRSWQETLRLYRQAGAGLLAAHQNGLVHRDFKPDNVLVDRAGRARVVDFGLARRQIPPTDAAPSIGEEAAAISGAAGQGEPGQWRDRQTVPGAIAGTPGYMSPEQYRGQPVDARSDQFSFCVALYQALFGKLPFPGETLAELSESTRAGQLRAPPADSPVPLAVREAIVRGLSTDPQARYGDLAELLDVVAIFDVDVESESAFTRATRRRLFALEAVTMAVLVVVNLYRYWRTPITLRDLISLAAATLAVTIAVGFAYRNTFLSHSFHRGLFVMWQITMCVWLALRCIAVPLHLNVGQVFSIELMALSGSFGVMGYFFIPRMWWCSGCLFVSSVVTSLLPQYAPWIGLVVHCFWPFIAIIAWQTVDVQGQLYRRAIGEKSVSSSRNTSRPSR